VAVESGLQLGSEGQPLQMAEKMTGKGEATNVTHVTWFDPECI
jgi:hypothetical protein